MTTLVFEPSPTCQQRTVGLHAHWFIRDMLIEDTIYIQNIEKHNTLMYFIFIEITFQSIRPIIDQSTML